MPQDDVGRFVDLVSKGFVAVGSRIRASSEPGCAIVRDIVVEFGPSISCSRASGPEAPFMTFPGDAIEAAASSVCMAVLADIVARAVEADENQA